MPFGFKAHRKHFGRNSLPWAGSSKRSLPEGLVHGFGDFAPTWLQRQCYQSKIRNQRSRLARRVTRGKLQQVLSLNRKFSIDNNRNWIEIYIRTVLFPHTMYRCQRNRYSRTYATKDIDNGPCHSQDQTSAIVTRFARKILLQNLVVLFLSERANESDRER